MEEAPVGIPSYDDDSFVDAVAQAYGGVRDRHLIVRKKDSHRSSWEVLDVSTEYEMVPIKVAEFDYEDLAVWFVQAHSNQPRVNNILRKSMDQAEEAERRYDELVQTIVFGGAK